MMRKYRKVKLHI